MYLTFKYLSFKQTQFHILNIPIHICFIINQLNYV